MDTAAIITQLTAERDRLNEAIAALSGISAANTTVAPTGKRRGRPPRTKNATKKPAKKRTMSPEGRTRIAAAQKARWAAMKKAK